MAKVKATVGMYKANRYCETHFEGEIITMEEYDELIENKEEEIQFDEREFSEYLAKYYTTDEVFAMTEEEKQIVQEDFARYCRNSASDSVSDGWEYIEIRTEVEISDEVLADIIAKKTTKAKCPCPCNQ